MNDPLQEMVGEQLGAVTFVQDYLQLQFGGPVLNVVTVATPQGRARSGDDQFRNLLCSCIAKKVSRVAVTEQEALSIHLADGSSIFVSLRDQDYRCPEAVNFHGRSNEMLVI